MRGWQAGVLLVVTAGLWLATGVRAAAVAALVLLTTLVIGLWYRWRVVAPDRLVIHSAPGSEQVAWGAVYRRRVEVVGRSHGATVEIVSLATLPGCPQGAVLFIGAGRRLQWDLEVPCWRRGVFGVGPVGYRAGDPLGLFPVARAVAPVQRVVVWPQAVPLARLAMAPQGTLPGELAVQRRGEVPPTVLSVRPYQPGDAPSAIVWKRRGRNDELVTRLYAPDVQPVVWLALDLPGTTAPAVAELLVTLAASVGQFFVAHQAEVAGLVADRVLAPAVGSAAWRQLIAALVTVAPGGDGLAIGQVRRQVQGGMMVVLVTARPSWWGPQLARLAAGGVAVRLVAVGARGDSCSVPTLWVDARLADEKAQLESQAGAVEEGAAWSAIDARRSHLEGALRRVLEDGG